MPVVLTNEREGGVLLMFIYKEEHCDIVTMVTCDLPVEQVSATHTVELQSSGQQLPYASYTHKKPQLIKTTAYHYFSW